MKYILSWRAYFSLSFAAAALIRPQYVTYRPFINWPIGNMSSNEKISLVCVRQIGHVLAPRISHHPDSCCSFRQTRQTRGQGQSLFHIIRPINNFHLNADEIKIELITTACMSKSGKQISYQRPPKPLFSILAAQRHELHRQPGNIQFGAQLKLGRLFSAARTRLPSRRRIV